MAVPAILGAAARLLSKEALKGAVKNKIKGAAKDKVSKRLKGKAKKISKEKLLGKKKDIGGPLALRNKQTSSIVPLKTPKILERKTRVNLGGSDLKDGKGGFSNSKTYAAILKEIQKLNKTFAALKKSISSKNAADKKAVSDRRKQLNIERKRAREEKLESRKAEKDSGSKESEDAPQLGIFEIIKRFFSNILIGGLLTLLLKNQGKVFKGIDLAIKNWRHITRFLLGPEFRKPFLRLLKFTSKVLLNPLYLPGKILKGTINLTGKAIKGTFSALGKGFKIAIDGIFKLGKKLIDAARAGVDLARKGLNFGGRAARAFTGALRGGQGIRGATQAVGTAAQRSARQAQQAKEARQAAEAAKKARDAKKASQAASTATQATRATTQATRATTQATTQAATSVAAKTARKAIRIPVIGPLLVAIDSWLSGDPPSQTLFKAGGAAIGGLLGNFIPIPVLGMMLGEYIGEYVGNLFYHGLKTPGGWKKAGDILWNDLKKAFDVGKTVMDWLQKGVGRYINNWPKLKIPNPGFPGPLKSILEATVLWKKPMKGLHQFLGGHPISPFKFIADNQWFGNKKGEFSQIPDPTFSVRNPIGFLKHIKNSFLGTIDKKPEYTPADLGDMSFPSDGSGSPPGPSQEDPSLGETFDVTDTTGPSKQAGGAVSSQSASKIVSSMGFSAEDWNLFKNTVAQIESGGRYNIAGGSGGHYDGRYQMGAAAKTDGARYAGIKDPGHSAAARAAFRKNPELQETLFAGYTKANHTYLMGNPKYKNANPQRKLQILGYAHNQGMGGAENWLNTGKVGADGFGTKGTKYTDAIAREFRKRGKISTTPSSPTPATPPSQAPSPAEVAATKDIKEGEDPNRKDITKDPGSSPAIPGQISSGQKNFNLDSLGQSSSSQGMTGAMVPVPMGGNNTPIGSSRARGMLGQVPASPNEVLNTYYKLQLLGFLYKQG